MSAASTPYQAKRLCVCLFLATAFGLLDGLFPLACVVRYAILLTELVESVVRLRAEAKDLEQCERVHDQPQRYRG